MPSIDTTGNDGIDLSFPSNNIGATDQQFQYQLTMVFIGVRDYSNQYPQQSGLFDDDFSFNAILSITNVNENLFDFSGGSRSKTAALIVSNPNYHPTTRQETAHAFCGFIELKIVKGALPPTTDFYGFRTTRFEIRSLLTHIRK